MGNTYESEYRILIYSFWGIAWDSMKETGAFLRYACVIRMADGGIHLPYYHTYLCRIILLSSEVCNSKQTSHPRQLSVSQLEKHNEKEKVERTGEC